MRDDDLDDPTRMGGRPVADVALVKTSRQDR